MPAVLSFHCFYRPWVQSTQNYLLNKLIPTALRNNRNAPRNQQFIPTPPCSVELSHVQPNFGLLTVAKL
uniref:Secreted protein n=1 Tax=Steinernema glaseri TaxID=37863 RepID=A0A1I7Z6G9_9BILA